jgi:hypothetical protein
MENSAIKKRIIISVSFLALFTVCGYIIYYLMTPPATCFDKKQNQSEKGIDCGGTCAPCQAALQAQDMVISEVAVALGGNDSYDVVAKISNPNDTVGSGSFKYVFNVKDSSDNIIATREGTTFILPADSKYVPELGLKMDNNATPVKVDFIISEVKWEKLNDFGKPQIGVFNKNFGPISPDSTGSEADGIISNDSGYDLNKIIVVIILRSEGGDIIGINKTEKNSVRTKERRDFRLTWPYQLSSPVQSMDVDAQSNMYDPQNLSFSVK